MKSEGQYTFRVTWENTDTAGYIHNSVAFRYFEIAELEWFRSFGGTWNDFPKHGFPRIHVEADFKIPLYFDDECIIKTRCYLLRAAKVGLEHEIWRGDDLCIKGKVIFTCILRENGKVQPIPERLRDALIERMDYAD